MGWANEKKIFASEVDDLKKKNKCKKFPDEDDGYFDDEDDFGEGCSEASGYTGRRSDHPPDGGWGWVVVFAAFVLNLIVDGIGFSFATAQQEYMEVFNATFAEVSLVGSSLTGSYLVVGPIVGALCFHLGLRTVTILGSLIAMIGFVLSSFATNLHMLILTYGIIGGIGIGMMYLPSIVCVSYWFDKKLSVVTGFAVCGSGVGQFVFPPLGDYLMQEYQWHGKHIIYGAIVLHGIVCGAVFRSPDRLNHKRSKQCRQRVEIERGIIMKALIEDKKRQRTISDGSLDNCIITTTNRLIKVEPSLFNCKKDKAFRKMLRQLGYSFQSLAVSKTSLQTSNQQVLMEALQQQQQQQQKQQQNGSTTSANNLPVLAIPPTVTTGQLQKRNSSPDFNKSVVMNGSTTADQLSSLNGFVSRSNSVKSANNSGGVLVGGAMMNGGLPILKCGAGVGSGSASSYSPVRFPKTRSCDALALAAQQQQQPYNMLIKKIMNERVRSNSECAGGTTHTHLHTSAPINNGNLPIGSSPALPVGSLDISIQEIPADEADNVVGSCYTSNTSLATDISNQFTREYVPNSSQNSFVTTYMMSEQLEASIREMDRIDRRNNSKLWCAWYMFVDMCKLIVRPVFTIFLVSTMFTLLAYFVPFYFIPTLGADIGMPHWEADFQLSIISVTSTIGRLIVGWLGDRPWINPLYLNNGAQMAAGLCLFLLPSVNSPEMLCVMNAILGFCLAVFVALRSVLLVKFLGVELIPKSYGLLCLAMGIATFLGNYLGGTLLDSTGDLGGPFYLAGLFTIMSGCIMCPLGCLKRREDRLNALKAAPAEEEEMMTEAADCNGHLAAGGATGGVGSPAHPCSIA